MYFCKSPNRCCLNSLDHHYVNTCIQCNASFYHDCIGHDNMITTALVMTM